MTVVQPTLVQRSGRKCFEASDSMYLVVMSLCRIRTVSWWAVRSRAECLASPGPASGTRLRRIIGVSSQVCTVSILSAHTHMLGRPAKRDETETESVLDV